MAISSEEHSEGIVDAKISQLHSHAPYYVCGLIALLFLGLAARDTFRQRALDQLAKQGTVVPTIKAGLLLAGRTQFDGESRAPFTLVEFGDYECPPCRHAQPLVAEVLKRYIGLIKLDFRELPLTNIHPHAQEAAIAAESARPAGKFWFVHDRLFTTALDRPGATSQVLTTAGVAIQDALAKKQIQLDNALETKLSVYATPTFFLCRPDGKVIRLPNIQALSTHLIK